MPVFANSEGLTLYYEDEGSGQVVLCLPGLTRNSRDFDYLAPHLADCRMIRLDPRGRGRSDHADPESYAIPIETQDALELLAHLGVDRFAVIGTSRGGMIAMGMAAAIKDRLTGICLVDIGPELVTEGLDRIRGYIGTPPEAKTMAEAAAARAATFPEFRGVPEDRWMEEARKSYVETGDGLALNYDPGLARVFDTADAAHVPDLWPLFDAMDGLPLALIRGAESNLLSAETAAEMRRRRPDMIFADVPDRGHVPFLDEVEAVAAIRAWIGRLP